MHRQARQRRLSKSLFVARSFVEFLDLYGSFAGEDLEDTDSSEDESAITDREADAEDGEYEPSERRPLLGRRRSSRRLPKEGDAGTVKTFFTLLKAFIGTGIMFLPKAFRNGGIVFSSMTLVIVSLINCICFRLLLDCRQKYGGGGYGDLGKAIVGPRFRSLVLASIAISQLGFVCSGLIFTAENLWAFLDAVSHRSRGLQIGVPALIALQLILLIPLALIRNISKLGPAALLADAFIMIGLVYIWYYDIQYLFTNGINPTVQLFNPSDYALTIGSAIFTFEGIGLILPIQSSMKNPQHFSGLLYLVMFLITIIFTSVGALCYATFGEDTKIQVMSNFPQDSALVNAVQFLYSMAVLGGEPVQLFPAIRIIETSLFGERATGKKSAAIKWQKNGLRTVVMTLCVGIAMVGATDLDKFVALIGSLACVPLVYIYPAFLHYHGTAESGWAKGLDIALILLGIVAMVFSTSITVSQWVR
ncbi:transmembrane amino acid transporter protein-domain-containing protein [Stachybotrys elegans]|uniref:Transmembrane amino acid transporter protein-domain-containing protein n=1 Tax=Stachybotrys elegans TaxID=80388 RepID=A0A8K0SYH9_9HYPO|nr:transmembrane amino acid transporter protein-domain-containing protein [Stachybotrys elegans]